MSSFNRQLNFKGVNTVPAVLAFLNVVYNLVCIACFETLCSNLGKYCKVMYSIKLTDKM